MEEKSKVVWIQGDNNTNFFHKFASYHKMKNSIWEIKDLDGHKVSGQDKIAEVGIFFSIIFKEPVGCPIAEILKVISLFPSFITDDMNTALQDEILEKELLQVLSSFQRCKSSSPDSFIVDF
jgi:hypothetical protein